MDFEHLLGLHTGARLEPLPILHIDPSIARALGARTRWVLLSAETVRKQLAHHRERPIGAYVFLRSCLSRGAYRQDGPRSALILFAEPHEDRRFARAYIKATQSGHEIYLTPFLTMRARDYRRELRKPYPVIRPALETRKEADEAS